MEEMGNMIAEVTKETKSVEITEVAGVANYIKDAISESLLEGVVKLDFPGNIKTETPPQKKEKKTSAVVPQPPVPQVTEKAIPNTYGDICDPTNLTQELTDEGMRPVRMDKEISQLIGLPLKIEYSDNINDIVEAHLQKLPLPVPSKIENVQLKLSSYIDKMPHGIVDKQLAGIGATSLEIGSKRNSIIVFPTKILAYNKWQRNKTKLLYVGGKINDERDTTSIKEIQSYLSDDKVVYKKFLVVADSLYKLLQIIEKERYKDYFLMIDEVDMIQSESNYRPRLESLIDHYFEFPPKNRCLVTATMREFSNPQLQQECKFNLSWKDTPKRKIQLYYTDNLDALTAQQIQSIDKAEKIVVAFNSIRHCKNIIKLLSEETRKECTIMCSDSSQDEAGDYYGELSSGNKLPNRINFITSCYFAGVDIEDYYHLITVSNAQQNYQMLSLDKMTQIYGRCRIPGGILSDIIIFNSREKWNTDAAKDYQSSLLKQASAILQLQQIATELGESDQDLQVLFELVKSGIREKGVINIPKEAAVRLTRRNIFKKDVTAYMNIDYLVERQKLGNTIYDSYNHLEFALKKLGHNVEFQYKYGSIPISEEQKKIETASKDELHAFIDAQLSEMIEDLREITKSRHLTGGEKQELQSKKGCSTFVYRFYQLQEYADADTLISHLWEIRHSDKRAYKNLQNAAVFWALDDKHPFKRDLLRVFKIGRKYKASEIHELMAPLVKYHLHKTIKQRAAVSLLKALFLVERSKIYLIKGKNPMGFKKHGPLRIPRTEENLLKYFQLS